MRNLETIVLVLFGLFLLASIVFGFSILIALLAGLILFSTYALLKGRKLADVFRMIGRGIFKARNILLTFLLIGMLTALWRLAGTIPSIVVYASGLMQPAIILPAVFLLNCLVSFLTGTSFGTGATMGVISASVALSMGVSPVLTGGAVLSGCYFGDRCSPISTSMLLTAELTQTDQSRNIRHMTKTALVPFIVTCAVYTALGLLSKSSESDSNTVQIFSESFSIGIIPLIPGAAILLLALLRVNVKLAMAVSIAVSIAVCVWIQHVPLGTIFLAMATGYQAGSAELGKLLNGGGITSMLKCGGIVMISSAFSGIFESTPLLEGIKNGIRSLADRTNAFAATLITSLLASVIACNQTLTIMLTDELCSSLCENSERFAIWIEDTAVLVAPLIPWSIAGSTIIYACGLPISGIAVACYLYFVPLWDLLAESRKLRKEKKA